MILILILLVPWLLIFQRPVRRGKRAGINSEGAAHKDVRRFRRRRMRLTEIPGLLADPAASSPGATLGRLSFGYFSLPFKEK
ncbi:MAG TPA: hypothetical protein VFH12_00340 [Pseudoxanthomonas sp.]|nr:hypothetical protein [Pseudoxanthomonas sp.]